MRSIVRRDNGEAIRSFLTRLAKEAASRRRPAKTWRSWIGNAERKDPTTTGRIRTIRMRRSPR